jgi:hypothetical protein
VEDRELYLSGVRLAMDDSEPFEKPQAAAGSF